MKWKARSDNGGKQVTSFVIDRCMVGKRSWNRVGEVDSIALMPSLMIKWRRAMHTSIASEPSMKRE